jgi:hypothetical protein
MPILDVEGMLQRLPARVRAELAWVKQPIGDAVQRLAREPADPNLLGAVAREVSEPLFRLAMALWKAVAESPDEWRAVFMQELERERERLRRFLQEAEAVDTVDWVIGLVRSLFTTALSLANLEELTDQAEGDMRAAAESETGRQLARGQLALMASIAVADNQGSPERAHDLLDLSFLSLIELQSDLRRAGYYLVAFPEETTAQRRARTLTSAGFLRDGFGQDDWQVMDSARLRDLR